MSSRSTTAARTWVSRWSAAASQDGILTCHWHHARFDLASGCTFDLWADDVPTCPVEVREPGEVWVKPVFGHADPAGHWRRRLQEGLAHNLDLVIAKAVRGQLAADVPASEIIRQVALFGLQNRDGWGVGLTILTAFGNLLPVLPEEETYLALFHGARRVAADCEGQPPRRDRAPLASQPDLAVLKRWLRHWTRVRHREAAERTLLTAIAAGASPAALADLLVSAATDRVYADGGHLLDFINKACECLDLIGWEHAAVVLPSVVGQLVSAQGAEEATAWRSPDRSGCSLRGGCSGAPGPAGECGWSGSPGLTHAVLAEALLGDEPNAILDALKAAIRAGASPVDLVALPGLCGSAPGGAVRDGQRALRLGDGPSRLQLQQCRSPGPEADRGGRRVAERCGRGNPGHSPRRHGGLSVPLSECAASTAAG